MRDPQNSKTNTVYITTHTHTPIKINMHKHVWNHGANSAHAIKTTFERDSAYNAIEVDVSSIDGVLMLAHDASDTHPDTSMDAFISTIRGVEEPFVIKFDFKDAFAISQGMRVIKLAKLDSATSRHTVVVHANALVGPGGGGRAVIMDASTFIHMARRELPRAQVHLGMNTGWNLKTLVFAHAYTHQHIDALAAHKGVVYCLHMAILSQTPRVVLDRIAGSPLLLWGESGVFERAWIDDNQDLRVDEDLQGVGVWLGVTYSWFALCVVLLLVVCYRWACFPSHVVVCYRGACISSHATHQTRAPAMKFGATDNPTDYMEYDVVCAQPPHCRYTQQ